MTNNSNSGMTIIEQWFRKIFTAQNIGILLAFISAGVAVITLMIEHREIFQTGIDTSDPAPQTAVETISEVPSRTASPASASAPVAAPTPDAAPAQTPKPTAAPAAKPAPVKTQTPVPASEPVPIKIDYSFNNPDVTFTFKKCVCSGGSAYVDIIIQNNSGAGLAASVLSQEPCAGYEDWKCVAYDDEGNSYEVTRLKAGGSDRAIGSNYPLNLPDGVPVKARIWFSGVARDASEFSLLKLSFRGMDTAEPYGAGLLQMKNIPISRP